MIKHNLELENEIICETQQKLCILQGVLLIATKKYSSTNSILLAQIFGLIQRKVELIKSD